MLNLTLYDAFGIEQLFLCKLLTVDEHQHHRRQTLNCKGKKCVAEQEDEPILVFVIAGPTRHKNEYVYNDEEYVRN